MLSQNSQNSTALMMIKLKNDTEAPEGVILTTMIAINKIKDESNVVLLYELVQKCLNPKYAMFGNSESDAHKIGLMTSGSIHEDTRNIILSAVEETGPLSFSISSPVATSPSIRP